MWEEVEVLKEYKHLVHCDNSMDWRLKREAVYKKGQRGLDFLRILRSFKVCN